MARRSQPAISNNLFAFTDKLGLQVNLAGTGDTNRVEVERALLLADFAFRTLAPLILVQARLPQEAKVLRACSPITEQYSAKGATAVVCRMRDITHTLAQQAHARGDFDAATKTFATAALTNIASICWGAGTAATKADAGYSLNCVVAVAEAITKAIAAGIPEQELLDLVVDVVADAMVMR